jgi:hypothetical protein
LNSSIGSLAGGVRPLCSWAPINTISLGALLCLGLDFYSNKINLVCLIQAESIESNRIICKLQTSIIRAKRDLYRTWTEF